MDKKYTIKDIARLAGVSKGTIDRVLHGRGKVSLKAEGKVKKVLKEIDYQPNLIARNLKNNKIYRICVLLPDANEDPYWLPAYEGIDKAFKEFGPFGILVEKYSYHPYDKSSFIIKSKKALQSSPDVLLMAPLFQKETLGIFKECEEKKIMVALFNNYIDAFNNKRFIGQDLNQSGRVAASLVDRMVPQGSCIVILHINEEAHMELKENGFRAYFKEKTAQYNITTHALNTDNLEKFKSEAKQLMKRYKDLSAIFVTNSKAHSLVEAIDELSKGVVIVGYDLLKENIEFLKEGKIDFLIHQKPKRQAYLGVGYLAEHFLFGKPIPSRNLLPIDIITTENIKYYLD